MEVDCDGVAAGQLGLNSALALDHGRWGCTMGQGAGLGLGQEKASGA